MKYFSTSNASKPVLTPDGKAFDFEPIKLFAGAWQGVIAVADEGDIASLLVLASTPKSGVKEITQAEYERQVKKKLVSPGFRQAPPSTPPPPARKAGAETAARPAAVEPAKGPSLEKVTGVVLEGAAPKTNLPPTPEVVPQSIDEVLQIGPVKGTAEPLSAPKKKAVKKVAKKPEMPPPAWPSASEGLTGIS